MNTAKPPKTTEETPEDNLDKSEESEIQADLENEELTKKNSERTESYEIPEKKLTRSPALYPLSPSRSPTTVKLVDPVVGPFVLAAELTTGPW